MYGLMRVKGQNVKYRSLFQKTHSSLFYVPTTFLECAIRRVCRYYTIIEAFFFFSTNYYASFDLHANLVPFGTCSGGQIWAVNSGGGKATKSDLQRGIIKHDKELELEIEIIFVG